MARVGGLNRESSRGWLCIHKLNRVGEGMDVVSVYCVAFKLKEET
jgi:hypothetical protein